MQHAAYKVFSARARESALRVRRHQSALGASAPSGTITPAIAARVKELLAGKHKASGGKGKAKGKAKPKAAAKKKDARTPQEKKNANRADVAKQTGMGDLEGALVRLNAGAGAAGQEDLEKDAHDKLIDQGLARRHADGSISLSPAGKKWKAAADKGDAATARSALNDAKSGQADRAAKEKTKADKAAARVAAQQTKAAARLTKQKKAKKAMTDLAIKAGRRHSQMDASHLDEAARHLHSAGATCPDCAPGDNPADEDIDADASKAIKGIMDDPGYYAQHECGDIMQAASGLQTLMMLIQSELSEEDEDDGQVQKLCDAAETLVAFLQGELDELRGAAKDDASTIGHEPMKTADNHAIRRALAGFDDATLDAHIMGGAIKALDDDSITGCAVLYGTKSAHDIEKDYYDKNTDLWLGDFGFPRPITYHHGMDAGTRDDPIVGHWTKAIQTDEGVWLEGQLDRAHKYYKAIKELASRGYLKMSSDSAPQWVIREPQSNGANYIKRWPLVTSSVTVTPMEPRMMPVEIKAYLAELGYDDTDSHEAINPEHARHDGAKAGNERTRALLLELDILELETA